MISHPKYNSLFIAISKTASSSIRNRLRRLGVAPPGWQVPDYVDYKHTQHLNIHEYRQILGQEDLDSRFKFTIVKNPWWRLVSSYTGICRNHRNPTLPKDGLHDPQYFHEWVAEVAFNKDWYDGYVCSRLGATPRCLHHRATYDSQLSWITDKNGKLAVDFIGRFENLNEDFRTILTRINKMHPLPEERCACWTLSHSNKSNRGHHYSFYYNDETVERVREHCREDIEEFGYEYEVE